MNNPSFIERKNLYSNNFFFLLKSKGMFSGFFIWIINLVIRSLAFSIFSITRKNIGSYSFNWFTVIFSSLLANTISRLALNNQKIDFPENLNYYLKGFTNIYSANSKILFLYSFFILLLGLYHILKEQLVNPKPFEMDRGPSILKNFFSSLNNKIDNSVFERIVEPAFFLVLGIAIYFLNSLTLSFFLILSSVSLFIEEQKHFKLESLYKRHGFS